MRDAIRDADRLLISVAFAREPGVRLLEKELKALRARSGSASLLVTTTLGMTTDGALSLADDLGVKVNVYNPARHTYHPKVYLGVGAGGRARAFIGSANLTAGLASNVEAGLFIDGSLRDEPLRSAYEWSEQLLDQPVVEWQRTPFPETTAAETLEPGLFAALEEERRRDPNFFTLGPDPKRNRVIAVQPDAVFVETGRSITRRHGGERIPAWMFNLAWDYLKAHGLLTNRCLLDELRVHRSSAVCALLARIPGVEVVPGRNVALRLAPPALPRI